MVPVWRACPKTSEEAGRKRTNRTVVSRRQIEPAWKELP
jgi:hypothetical protein